MEQKKEVKKRVRLDNSTWNKIKMEWCFKGTSFKNLAEQYGIGKNTIEKRSVKEDWSLYKLTNKVERTQSILAYSSDMVKTYRDMIDLLKDDLTLWKGLEFKDKKILIECFKLADCEVARHLMISEND